MAATQATQEPTGTLDPHAVSAWLAAPAARGMTNAEQLGVAEQRFRYDQPEFPALVKRLVDAADEAGMFRLPPGHRVQLTTQNTSDPNMGEYVGYHLHLSTPNGQTRSTILAPALASYGQQGEQAATKVLADTGHAARWLLDRLQDDRGTGVAEPRRAVDPVRRRTDELLASGRYPNRTQAWRAAEREVADQQRRAVEDNVLAAAAQLDPADSSPAARLVREAAGSIADHRTSQAIRQQDRRHGATGQAPPAPASGNPARLAAASFATPASAGLAAGTTADGRGDGLAGRSAAQVATAAPRGTGATPGRRSR